MKKAWVHCTPNGRCGDRQRIRFDDAPYKKKCSNMFPVIIRSIASDHARSMVIAKARKCDVKAGLKLPLYLYELNNELAKLEKGRKENEK